MSGRSKAFRLHASLAICAAILAVQAARAAAADAANSDAQAAKPASEKQPRKPYVAVTISRQTTYLVRPLRPDGYVDYLAALNEAASQGVTVENNAAVLLWQALGPKDIAEKARDRFFQRLGIPPLPDSGPYLVSLGDYAKGYKAPAKARQEKLAQDSEEDEPGKQLERAMERPWTKNDCPLVAAWLQANQAPLRLVVEASKRPRYYSPLIAGDDNSLLIAVLLPHLNGPRDAARALVARAMLRVQAGQLDAACEDLLACHRLGGLMGQGTTLIDALVGIAVDGIACAGDRALAQHGKLSAEQLGKFQAELRGLAPLPKMIDKINTGERYMFLDAVCSIARGGLSTLSTLTAVAGDGSTQQPAIVRSLMDLATRVGVNWDEVLRMGNQFYDRLEEAAKRATYAERRAAMAKLEKELKDTHAKVRDPKSLALELLSGQSPRLVLSRRMGGVFLTLLAPALSAAITAEDRATVQFEQTRVALALAGYRADHGGYPDSLAKLAPTYLSEVPKDLFTGEQFRYRRTDAGYVLYSVGPNGKDDGGRGRLMAPSDEQDEAPADADDIGFRVPAKAGK